MSHNHDLTFSWHGQVHTTSRNGVQSFALNSDMGCFGSRTAAFLISAFKKFFQKTLFSFSELDSGAWLHCYMIGTRNEKNLSFISLYCSTMNVVCICWSQQPWCIHDANCRDFSWHDGLLMLWLYSYGGLCKANAFSAVRIYDLSLAY